MDEADEAREIEERTASEEDAMRHILTVQIARAHNRSLDYEGQPMLAHYEGDLIARLFDSLNRRDEL